MKTKLHIAASVALLMAASSANPALAQARDWFDLGWGGVGASSNTRCFQGLCARVFIKRVNVNGDRNEICAELENSGSGSWVGAYRLTHLDDPTTMASLRVGAGQTAERCEIVPQQSGYYLVLRNDS